MTTCEECSHELAANATACPNCGYQQRRSFSEWTVRVLVAVIGVIALFWLLAHLG